MKIWFIKFYRPKNHENLVYKIRDIESIRACEYCCAGFVCPMGTTYRSNPCAS